MPDATSLTVEMLLPTNPLHFLKIIRYVSLLIVILLIILPDEGGIVFLLLLGITGVLIVSDVYNDQVFSESDRFVVFMIRVFAFAIPIMMTGSTGSNTASQASGILAVLGILVILVTLFAPSLDPTF